jgi:hypothetical protein
MATEKKYMHMKKNALFILILLYNVSFSQTDLDKQYQKYSQQIDSTFHLNDSLSKGFITKAKDDFSKGTICYPNIYDKLFSKETAEKILELDYGIEKCWAGGDMIMDEYMLYEMTMKDLIKSKYGQDFFTKISKQADSLDQMDKGYRGFRYAASEEELNTIFEPFFTQIQNDSALEEYEYCLITGTIDTLTAFKINYFSLGHDLFNLETNELNHVGRFDLYKILKTLNVSKPAYFKGNPINSKFTIILDMEAKLVELTN